MRYALVFNIISLVTFLAAVGFLAFRGLNFSIEFTGGTLIEVGYKQAADVDAIRQGLDKAGYKAEVQNFGSSREVLIRMHLGKNQSSADLSQKVISVLKQQDGTAELRRVEFVGPQVGRELAEYGALALLVTAIGIVLYRGCASSGDSACGDRRQRHECHILGFFDYSGEFSAGVPPRCWRARTR